MRKMPDVPRATQNTFICYSKLPRDGGRQPIPGGIPVFQAPAFQSYSGIASASGQLSNELISIQPKVDENGGFSWEVTGKKQAEAGIFSFSVTVATKGNDKFAAVSQTFTFQVVVYRNAVPQPQTTFLQLAVGESIDAAGLIPWVVNPVIDYNVRHEGPLGDSGLYIACDRTDRGAITNVHLRGTAAKVGTWLFLTEAQTWDEGGQYDHLPSSFPAGQGAVPVVVSVYKKFDAGTVIVADQEAGYSRDADFLRLISGGYTGSALGRFTRSGNVWTRSARELINPANQLYEVFDYRVELSGETWQFTGRRYFSDEQPGDFEQLGSAQAVGFGSEVPPSGSWGDGVKFIGDTRFFVPGYGFFDNKGLPDRYQSWNGAFLLADANGGWWIGETAVSPIELTGGTALPFSPATSEKVGSRPVRDIAGESLNLNRLPGSGQLAFATGRNGVSGGFWQFYPLHRQIVPPNGTTGVTAPTISGSFTEKARRETVEINANDSHDISCNMDGECTTSSSGFNERGDRFDNYTATLNAGTASCSTRDGDLLKRVFLYNPEASAGLELDRRYDYRSELKDPGAPAVREITERTEVIEQLSGISDLQAYFSSGRQAPGEKAQVFTGGTASGGASWKIQTTRTETDLEPVVSESTVSVNFGGAAGSLGSGVGLPDYRTESHSDSAKYTEVAYRNIYREGSEEGSMVMRREERDLTVELSHTASLVYKNGQLIKDESTAKTVIKRTERQEWWDWTSDDPGTGDETTTENTQELDDWDGSAFDQALDELEVRTNFPPDFYPDFDVPGGRLMLDNKNGNVTFYSSINRTIRTFSGTTNTEEEN